MSGHGKRLRAWRESLPRGPIKARSLALALDWEESRWWHLEQKDAWSPRVTDDVSQAMCAILDRLAVDDEGRKAALAYVLDGGELPPAPVRWLDGMCPAQPIGRKRGTRVRDGFAVLPREDSREDSPQAARPIIPETLRRTQVAAILRSFVEGGADEEEALAAIAHVYRRDLSGKFDQTEAQGVDAA